MVPDSLPSCRKPMLCRPLIISRTSTSKASDGIKVEYFVFGSGPETLLMIPGNGRWAGSRRHRQRDRGSGL